MALADNKAKIQALIAGINALPNAGSGGGITFVTDETLSLVNGILSVNTTDEAAETDPRPITAQGVYNEFAVINALLKTI